MKFVKQILLLCGVLGISAVLHAQTFTLTSPDVEGQFTAGYLSNVFGCQGENTSPTLQWINSPKGTKSFAVTMFDPDAPSGSGWWHWVVYNIPASVNSLPKGAGSVLKHLLPEGSMQGLTDFGVPGYGGPCPPEGDKPHGYVITVYALDTDNLGLDKTASPALVGFVIGKHLLGKASLIIYSKR